MSLHVERDLEKPLLCMEGVHKTFAHDGVPVHALRGIDLVVARGEFVAVMGTSGSGKSTLLHIAGLLDADYEGSYRFDGELVSGRAADELSQLRNREIGFVFQQFHLLPQLTILENAALPALYSRDRAPDVCEKLARLRLEEVGLGDRLDHRPNQISSGQRQRAAIARALVNEPRLILADEPTGALDSKNAQEILDLFLQLHRSGSTIVLITHDVDVASAAERIVHIRDGQTIDGLL
jgi:putative ABC transport system ATP-binding protein